MSIEWLLVKTQNAEFHKPTWQGAPRTKQSPDNSCSSPPNRPTEDALNHEGQRQPENKLATPHQAEELERGLLRRKCRHEGAMSLSEVDFKKSADPKSGVVRFECPNCGRFLQYDHLTGTIRPRRGIRGFLLGRFS